MQTEILVIPKVSHPAMLSFAEKTRSNAAEMFDTSSLLEIRPMVNSNDFC